MFAHLRGTHGVVLNLIQQGQQGRKLGPPRVLPGCDMTAFHTACHRVRIYKHPCSAMAGPIYGRYRGIFGLLCHLVGRPSEEPGHR
jgi:hypothetical protein